MSVTRRNVLKYGAVGAAGAAAAVVGGTALSSAISGGGGLAVLSHHDVEAASASQLADANFPRRFTRTLPIPAKLVPFAQGIDPDGHPFKKYQLRVRPFNKSLVEGGLLTPLIGYNAQVSAPTIEVDKGTRTEVTVRNHLPATHPTFGHPMSLSTHLHGSASLPQFDGYAADLTPPGMMKTYHYPNYQVARTLWYHDHAEMLTAQNVLSGLAGQYHIHDAEERALLPQGAFDVPLTVTDAMFDAAGRLLFDDRDHSGVWGDVIMVNGAPWPVMKVQPRIYRFRVLNASVSRSYRFKLSNGMPFTLVATDGGLVPQSQQLASWRHAPSERYEVLIDFRGQAGKRIELQNLSNPNNRDFDFTNKVMAFDVQNVTPTKTKPDGSPDPTWNTIPIILAPNNEAMVLPESAATKVRSMRIKRDDFNRWMVGGQTWEDVQASDYNLLIADPEHDAVEIWEFDNDHDGWFHPIHIHMVDFRILSRNGQPALPHERGPKDVVYAGENEKVRLLIHFAPQRGKYMMHCHNLTHEDHSMMVQFTVGMVPGEPDPNDPRNAARPVADADPSLA